MQIVPQFAPFSYCTLPCVPMLPAPKIAGLLPAGPLPAPQILAPRKVVADEIFFDEPLTLEALERAAGPFLTIEEMDAEIATLLDAFRQNEKWTWTRARATAASPKERLQ